MNKAGRMRRKITIESDTPTQNTYGEPIESWSTYATVWASVEPLNGREYFNSQQTAAEISTRFRIRYKSGITPDMRVVLDSNNYDIRSIINVNEHNKELILMCDLRL